MPAKRTGDYVLATNRPVISRGRGPTITATSGGKGVIVCNTERLSGSAVNGDGTVVYKKSGFALNPASSNLFPWLANVAKSYQLYRWKSIKISYVPAVPTTEAGYVEAGVFYDYEDYTHWALDVSALPSLSYLGEFSTGPPYSGGQLATTEDRRGTSTQNWFGMTVDVNAAHRRYPWLTIDPSPSADHTQNLSVGAYAAFQTYTSSGTNRLWGVPFISYEIELLHPAIPAFHTPTGLLRMAEVSDDGPHCPPGGPCDPFPPRKPPPDEVIGRETET